MWCSKWCSATLYQKVNSSIVSKGAMNSFNKIFPLATMFPLAVMHTTSDTMEVFLYLGKYYLKPVTTFLVYDGSPFIAK